MKKIKYTIVLTYCIVLSVACKKDSRPILPLSSLNVVNAITDQSQVQINTLGQGVIYSTFPTLGYGSAQVYSISVGNPYVSVNLVSDTVHPFFSQKISTINGGINSLYLYGQSPSLGSLQLKDNIPAYQDSTSGARFINLCEDSQPVTINLQGNGADQTEFANLSFKQISIFKGYSAKSAFSAAGYTFEVRDASSGTLLTTFTWYFKPFFCNTLVISGKESDGSINVFSVNNF